MKYLSLLAALLLAIMPLSAQQQTTYTVFFDFDRHELTAQATEALASLSEKLTVLPDYRVEIQAHTDDRGTDTYNHQLAQRRADAVLHYLTQHDILVEKTTVLNFGESQPAYANADEPSRQLNRRVDVLVTSWTFDSVDEIFSRIGGEATQLFSIDPSCNTRIVGREGTNIWIPAGSLVLPDGNTPKGAVRLALEEAYAVEDMLLQNLHTTAGESLLETGGMFRLEASAGGQALQVRKDAALTVAMPAAELQEDMELFNGVTGPDGELADWVPAGQDFAAELEGTLNLPPAPIRPRFVFLPPAFTPDLSGQPIPPARPIPPFKPHEPRRESFQYNPGFVQRLFTDMKKVEAQEEADYQNALEEYRAKLTRYEADKIAHREVVKKYEREYEKYEEALTQWEAGIERQRKNWRQSLPYRAAVEKGRAEFLQLMEVWRKKRAAWEAERAGQLREFEEKYDAAGNIDAASVNNYFYQINTLGWINCDRFRQVPEEDRMPLVIEDGDATQERIFIVFESMNSIVTAFKRDRQYRTNALPQDAAVKVIGIKVHEGRPQLAVHDLVVKEAAGRPMALDYRTCKLRDIRQALSQLN